MITMPAAKGLVTVWLHVPPEREEEFNAWYNLEHIAQVVNIPGFTAARRYAADGQVPKYLAWYEAVDEHVEPGPGFTQIVQHPTPWSLRIRRFYGENRFRNNYRMVSSFGTVPTPDAAWLYTVQADCADPAQLAEFNDWYDNEHMPALAEVPGVLRARRYVAVSGSPLSLSAFELTHREVFESPAWLEARQTPRTERIRKLFTNGRRIMYRLILPTMLPAASSNR
jgi:hypothetical protein